MLPCGCTFRLLSSPHRGYQLSNVKGVCMFSTPRRQTGHQEDVISLPMKKKMCRTAGKEFSIIKPALKLLTVRKRKRKCFRVFSFFFPLFLFEKHFRCLSFKCQSQSFNCLETLRPKWGVFTAFTACLHCHL